MSERRLRVISTEQENFVDVEDAFLLEVDFADEREPVLYSVVNMFALETWEKVTVDWPEDARIRVLGSFATIDSMRESYLHGKEAQEKAQLEAEVDQIEDSMLRSKRLIGETDINVLSAAYRAGAERVIAEIDEPELATRPFDEVKNPHMNPDLEGDVLQTMQTMQEEAIWHIFGEIDEHRLATMIGWYETCLEQPYTFNRDLLTDDPYDSNPMHAPRVKVTQDNVRSGIAEVLELDGQLGILSGADQQLLDTAQHIVDGTYTEMHSDSDSARTPQ